MDIKNQILDNSIIVFADKSIFSKDSILKCTYWYTDHFNTTIDLVEDKYYRIKLTPNNNSSISKQDLEKYFEKLQKDLIDFNLRDIITKETSNIRDLLIAKAFSHYNTEELPPEDE